MTVFLQYANVNNTLENFLFFPALSLSGTEHGWAHGSNTVYSVIHVHGSTGTSIELQPCLGMSWHDLDSNVARVYPNKARIYSIKQGLSRFEHNLRNYFHTIVVRFQVRSSTVCYSLVRLNTTFTRLTVYIRSHRLLFEFDSMRFIYDIDTVEFTGGVDLMCGCIYGLVWSHTVSHGLLRSRTDSHGLSRSCMVANSFIHGHCTRVRFLKVLKIIHGFHGYTRMARV